LITFTAAWNDHARDLLHMVNHFRASMPRPLIGVGHSMGGNQLVNLAYMHPRLLSTIILLDPVISSHKRGFDPNQGPGPAQASTFRRDLWPSRAEAEAGFKKSKFYQSWDSRVLDRWMKYGIRQVPTAVYPDAKEGSMTLSTTKSQEVFVFLRPLFGNRKGIDRAEHPDVIPEAMSSFPFYRTEAPLTMMRIESLRPSALYIFGEKSPMSSPAAQKEKVDRTGNGIGGSGGAKERRVKGVSLKGVGHLVAMEDVEGCADPAADWIGKEMERWKVEEQKYIEWTKKSQLEKSTISEEWKKRMREPIEVKPKGKL